MNQTRPVTCVRSECGVRRMNRTLPGDAPGPRGDRRRTADTAEGTAPPDPRSHRGPRCARLKQTRTAISVEMRRLEPLSLSWRTALTPRHRSLTDPLSPPTAQRGDVSPGRAAGESETRTLGTMETRGHDKHPPLPRSRVVVASHSYPTQCLQIACSYSPVAKPPHPPPLPQLQPLPRLRCFPYVSTCPLTHVHTHT